MMFSPKSLIAATLLSFASAGCEASYGFTLMSLRSASPIHFNLVNAAQSGLWLGLKKNHASCLTNNHHQYAIFRFIGDGTVRLFDPAGPVQQLYVDRTADGQGRVGYTTGKEAPPEGAEVTGWQFKEEYGDSYLYFKGKSLRACPGGVDDSWSVWLDNGVAHPGGNSGCLSFSALLAVKYTPAHDQSCTYSS